MECLSLVQRHSPRRVALRTLSGKARMLRRREHRTPGQKTLPLALPNSSRRKPAAVRSAPGRGRAEGWVYTAFWRESKVCRDQCGEFAVPAGSCRNLVQELQIQSRTRIIELLVW